jgi:hypothetical protein
MAFNQTAYQNRAIRNIQNVRPLVPSSSLAANRLRNSTSSMKPAS